LTSAHCAFAALREHAVGRLALACRLWRATAGLRLAARPVESPVATCNCGLSRSFTPQSALRTGRPVRSIRNPQSAIHLRRGYGGQVRNRPAPTSQRTGAQPKFHTVYGTRTGFDTLLMVCHDAWHLIIFRALGGRNARKCFCKNGTYVNLGLSNKVKKPFKTVKKR